MQKFNLMVDWKFISWKATLITSLYRSFAAGIVFMIAMLIFRDPGMKLSAVFSAPIVVPISYFVIFLPLGLLAMSLNRMGVPYVGLVSIVCSIFIIPGDPLLWIFHKLTNEQYVPVKHLDFINFAIIIMVVDEERKAASLRRVAA